MSKQTAVEWLIEQLDYFQSTKNERSLILQLDLYEEYCEEAKAMEKEQIGEAYKNGFAYRDTFGWEGETDWNDQVGFIENEMELKEYYNKTYGGDK